MVFFSKQIPPLIVTNGHPGWSQWQVPINFKVDIFFSTSNQPIHDISYCLQANYCIFNIMEKWLLFHPGFCLCYPGFMFKTGTCHVQGPS